MSGMSYDHMAAQAPQDLSNHTQMKGLPSSIDDMEDLQEYLNSGKAPTASEEAMEGPIMQKGMVQKGVSLKKKGKK